MGVSAHAHLKYVKKSLNRLPYHLNFVPLIGNRGRETTGSNINAISAHAH